MRNRGCIIIPHQGIRKRMATRKRQHINRDNKMRKPEKRQREDRTEVK